MVSGTTRGHLSVTGGQKKGTIQSMEGAFWLIRLMSAVA